MRRLPKASSYGAEKLTSYGTHQLPPPTCSAYSTAPRSWRRLVLFLLLVAGSLFLLDPRSSLDIPSSIPATLLAWLPIPSSHSPPLESASAVDGFSLVSAHHIGTQYYPKRYASKRYTEREAVAFRANAAGTANIASFTSPPPLQLKAVRKRITRLRDPRAYLAQRARVIEQLPSDDNCSAANNDAVSSEYFAESLTKHAVDAAGGWETGVEISAPNVSDRITVLNLAKMAGAAYYAPNDTMEWKPEPGWNLSSSFGWVEDGIRGHVFATPGNETIVIALKGTSAAVLPGGGDTARRDKVNDNLLFSCCCAHVGWGWRPVCKCFEDGSGSRDQDMRSVAAAANLSDASTIASQPQRCEKSCLSRSLMKRSVYYPATTDLYNNISYMYPDSQIWLTGHSLGGALASLIGMTFGVPVVTFEAPAERMAAKRLHLPLPPGLPRRKDDERDEDAKKSADDAGDGVDTYAWDSDEAPITHVYHSADPIPMGECVGATSLCATAGFAMESRCHAGRTLFYDTVGMLGWSSNIVTHRIAELIDRVLDEDWDVKVAKSQKKRLLAYARGGSLGATRWWWPIGGRDGEAREGDGDADGDDDDKPKDGEGAKPKLGAVPELTDQHKCKDCPEWKYYDDAP